MASRVSALSAGIRAAAIAAAILMNSGMASAQDSCTRLLVEATDAYKIGDFAEVVRMTDRCLIAKPTSDQREQALALRSNVFLATDDLQSAESAVAALLGTNPEFTAAVDDTERFRSLVDRIRRESSIDAVSSVSKMNESLLEAPATVVVVTAEQIRRRGYADLEAVLHDLPGFDISRTNGQSYSNIYQRGYRSDATNRTLFLVDGIEQNDLFSNIAYISRQYSLSDVERVEVVYGPASTMYGANAFLGVINVVTRDPDRILGDSRQFAGEAHVGGGVWNTRFFDATIAARFRGATVSMTARRFRSDEWDLSGFNSWNYQYDPARYQEKFSDAGPYRGVPDAVAEAIALDKAALGSMNGVPIGYSDLTDDWLVSGKVKIRDFLVGMQVWQAREGAAASSTKLAQPGARNGNVWVPALTSVYARYATALPGNLRLTYFGQAKVHSLEPDSSGFLFRSYVGGPLGVLDLLNSPPEPAFWAQTRLAQSSNQVRNEIDMVYRAHESLNIIGGVDLRFASVQTDYSKSSNCVEIPQDPIATNGRDIAQLFNTPILLLDAEGFSLRFDVFDRIAAKLGSFVGYAENDRSLCKPRPGPVEAPISFGDHTAVREIGVFGQASYRPLPALKLVGGLRIDNGDVKLRGGYGTVATPRLAMVVTTPGDVVLKAIYAEAFKDPANSERYASIPGIRAVGNPNLQPERVRNFELSAGRQSTSYAADVSLYRAQYSDVIAVTEQSLYDRLNSDRYGHFSDRLTEQWYFTPCPLSECFVNAIGQVPADVRSEVADAFLSDPISDLASDNIATLNVWGLQSTGSWRRNTLEVFGNYTFTRPSVVGTAAESAHIGDIAKHSGMLGVANTWGRIGANARVEFIGRRSTESTAILNRGPLSYIETQGDRILYDVPLPPLASAQITFPTHAVAHVTGSYEFARGLTVQATISNLFNTSYADPGIQAADNALFAARIPQPGRTAFVRLISRF